MHTYTHTGSSSIVLFNMCYILFSCSGILIGQGFICRYIFMAMYSFLPPSHEAKFCGVPSCVFDKLGCAVGKKRLRNTDLGSAFSIKKGADTHMWHGNQCLFNFCIQWQFF
jgi:hypothetical protein